MGHIMEKQELQKKAAAWRSTSARDREHCGGAHAQEGTTFFWGEQVHKFSIKVQMYIHVPSSGHTSADDGDPSMELKSKLFI